MNRIVFKLRVFSSPPWRVRLWRRGWVLPLFIFCISSCEEDEYFAPKPKGYLRIAYPEKQYVTYDSLCPFTFEYPAYSKIVYDKRHNERCWMNLEFYKLGATIHLSYKDITGSLSKAIEDSWVLASKHQVKAEGMEEELIKNDSTKVYGLVYHIEGNAASSLQFFLTDSTKHFIRGSFYFNCKPNKDSLAPSLAFIKKDVEKFIQTFRWK